MVREFENEIETIIPHKVIVSDPDKDELEEEVSIPINGPVSVFCNIKEEKWRPEIIPSLKV